MLKFIENFPSELTSVFCKLGTLLLLGALWGLGQVLGVGFKVFGFGLTADTSYAQAGSHKTTRRFWKGVTK